MIASEAVGTTDVDTALSDLQAHLNLIFARTRSGRGVRHRGLRARSGAPPVDGGDPHRGRPNRRPARGR
ncbi:hypothetical protein CTI14_24540 [Methylobacterium radiotolerans]|nr:hypothetical protein CTI14_24540 [Methylobacterium radiotolerans]